MASIIKRRKKFSVVYRYTDENGKLDDICTENRDDEE